ncbi:MAG: PEP-CTERM sorting domain-containing protein [Gemmatimonadaceae bacterium]
MRFGEFIGSGPMGVVAGTVTVLLGVGAMAALAFGSSAPTAKPMGDARLSAGGQAFEAALVASAGANDVGRVHRSGGGMADGPVVAGPASATGNAAAAAATGMADGGQSTQSRRGATSGAATTSGAESVRSGSAAYYRTLLGAGAVGGLGTFAMMSRGRSVRHAAGDPDAAGLALGGAILTGGPLVPSRAFGGYGANDVGSSTVKPGGQAASGNTPSGVQQSSSPAPSATDPLGEHAAAAPGAKKTDRMPAAPRVPPAGAVIGAEAILTPEPGTWVLVGSGLLALGLVGRRRIGRAG